VSTMGPLNARRPRSPAVTPARRVACISLGARYAGILREHIAPKWQTVRLANVSHADVQAWITALSATRSPSTMRKVHRVLSLSLDLTVRVGRSRATWQKINLPRPVRHDQRHLSVTQVEARQPSAATPSTFSKHRPLAERQCEALPAWDVTTALAWADAEDPLPAVAPALPDDQVVDLASYPGQR
jgi:hypothetical protein